MKGSVVSIHLAGVRGGAPRSVPDVQAIAGRGLEGDRYCRVGETPGGTPDQEVTLVESEALEALHRDHGVEITGADTRRNLLTKGVALNHLVGRTFRAGGATLRGLGLCEPCGHLEKMSKRGVRKGLVHRGGLRAEILSGGTIRAGDPIEEIEAH
jgi:MOSC domain-containing protein YiiM